MMLTPSRIDSIKFTYTVVSKSFIRLLSAEKLCHFGTTVFLFEVAMSQLRKRTNFTIVSNQIVNDDSLSLKSKGIYLYLCSKPDGWDFYIPEIAKWCTDGIKSVRSGLKELEEAGYLFRHRLNGNGGKFEYDYEIFETPSARLPHTPEGHAVEGHAVEGHTLQGHSNNTNTNNTNLNNTDEKSYAHSKKEKMFSDLWELYDLKKNKDAAWSNFQKLSKSQIEEVRNNVSNYVKNTVKSGYPARMHLSTYLNPVRKRWQDEVVPMSQNGNQPERNVSVQYEETMDLGEVMS